MKSLSQPIVGPPKAKPNPIRAKVSEAEPSLKPASSSSSAAENVIANEAPIANMPYVAHKLNQPGTRLRVAGLNPELVVGSEEVFTVKASNNKVQTPIAVSVAYTHRQLEIAMSNKHAAKKPMPTPVVTQPIARAFRLGPKMFAASAGVVIQTPAAANPVKNSATRVTTEFGDQLNAMRPIVTPKRPHFAVLANPKAPMVNATTKDPNR